MIDVVVRCMTGGCFDEWMYGWLEVCIGCLIVGDWLGLCRGLIIHSFIADIYIAPLQVGLLRSAPNLSAAEQCYFKFLK